MLVLLGGTALATACAGPGGGPLDDVLAGFVSPRQEAELGAQAFAQIKARERISRDATQTRRLQQVGERIVMASESDIPAHQWEFVLFENDQINAFALPGGKVGFFTGIFRLFDDDAELATVVGHEVGHVNARHAAQRIGASQLSGIGVEALSAILAGPGGRRTELAALLGVGADLAVVRPFSRGQELEADELGVGYMARAGYDPERALSFWRKMSEATGDARVPTFLATHPPDQARIRALQAALPEARAIYSRTG